MTTELSQDNTAENEVSPLGMSDEEVLNMDFSQLEVTEEAEGGEASPAEEDEDESTTEEEPTEEEAEDDSEEEEEDAPDTEEGSDEDVDPEIDYKEAYEKLLGPIKANGTELKVDNVDDALRLMQMGANYNKKMAALKPNLKIMKMLEKQNLLDEDKLNYLIDLDKKNPDAIKKMIKESEIELHEFDLDSESEYQPSTYTVDDKELAVDEALEAIKDTPTYSRTIDVIGTKWDGSSKQTIANNPNLLEVINAHMASGVYDLVSKEVEKERTFGRLQGLSDLEAYQATGDAMDKKGAFNHLVNQSKGSPKKTITKNKPKDSAQSSSKKRAASSANKSKGASNSGPVDVLGMSDAEFEKEILSQYL
jgi:hypothetical protein